MKTSGGTDAKSMRVAAEAVVQVKPRDVFFLDFFLTSSDYLYCYRCLFFF
ncbi:hypothetical protein LINGRAHAP2_LOCUS29584, partial [Linum grandiflorum]